MTMITIHRGELLQIKRMISGTKDKNRMNLKGSLYGLYTESYQPVTLIVCGGSNKKVEKYLSDNHKLLPLGEWVVSDHPEKAPKQLKKSNKTVTMVFDSKGECISTFYSGSPATLAIIEGQSALRDYKIVTDELQAKTKLDCSPIKTESIDRREKVVQAQEHLARATDLRTSRNHVIDVEDHKDDVSSHTRTDQWYNTDRNTLANTFEFVRRTFTDDENVEISRNTLTENMIFKFKHSRYFWVFEFPAKFPKGVIKLRKMNKESGEEVTESVSLQQPADLARMKNALNKNFVKMCKCSICSDTERGVWV